MALLIEIKVKPQSGRQLCTLDKSGLLKCFLKSPPEGGKANEELIKFLSKALSIPQNSINIIRGASSRSKLLRIDAHLDRTALLKKLGIEMQKSL